MEQASAWPRGKPKQKKKRLGLVEMPYEKIRKDRKIMEKMGKDHDFGAPSSQINGWTRPRRE